MFQFTACPGVTPESIESLQSSS